MNDVISRNAAITTAKNAYTACGDRSKEDYRDMLIACLEELPFAQLEIIRCKDCKYQDKGSNESDSWNLCGYRPWLNVPTNDEHYCGYAKRRTDDGE